MISVLGSEIRITTVNLMEAKTLVGETLGDPSFARLMEKRHLLE